MMDSEQAERGGFIVPYNSYPTPTPSSPAPSSVSSTLPKQRSHPIRPASAKESTLINYVDRKMLRVTRRYAKKFLSAGVLQMNTRPAGTSALPHALDQHPELEPSKGYETFREVVKEMDVVIDLVWVSGTPTLQIPYLLSVALLAVTYLPSFPPAPKPMFRLLDKLDLAFASLAEGADVTTGEPLSGMINRKGLSGTEKVRVKSLIERTRVVVVEVMQQEGAYDEDKDDSNDDSNDDGGDQDAMGADDIDMDYGMEIARVYDRTLQFLGDSLGGPQIGIPDA